MRPRSFPSPPPSIPRSFAAAPSAPSATAAEVFTASRRRSTSSLSSSVARRGTPLPPLSSSVRAISSRRSATESTCRRERRRCAVRRAFHLTIVVCSLGVGDMAVCCGLSVRALVRASFRIPSSFSCECSHRSVQLGGLTIAWPDGLMLAPIGHTGEIQQLVEVMLHRGRLELASGKPSAAATVVEADLHREVGEEDLAARQAVSLALVAHAREDWVQEAPVQRRPDDAWRALVQVLGRAVGQTANGCRVAAGDEMERLSGFAERLLRKRADRVGHVVDRDYVDGRGAVGGEKRQSPPDEGLERRVQDVERRGPATPSLADDDARAEDLHRKALAVPVHERLRFVLRLLVRVAKALAHLEVVLVERSGVV